MQYKVITLRLDPESRRFDDAPLARALAGQEPLEIGHHVFTHRGEPGLALVVTLRDRPAKPRKTRSAADWLAELPIQDRPIFEGLRAWRLEQARAAGLSPFLVLTNRQLATIAVTRPATLEDLGHVAGFGPSRIARFGEALLAELARVEAAAAGAPDEVAVGA